MKKFLIWILLLIIYIVQTSIVSRINIGGIKINLFLIFTLVYCVKSDVLTSCIMGFVCGLLTDFSLSGDVGYNTMVIMFISIITAVVSNKIYSEYLTVFVFIIFTAVVSCEIINFVIYNILYECDSIVGPLVRCILPKTVINTALSIPFVYLIKHLKNEYIRGI